MGVLIAAFVLGAWLISSQILRPPWMPGPSLDGRLPIVENATWHGFDSDPHAEFGIDFEDVVIPAEDGTSMRGWYVAGDASNQAALVLVHGAGGDRRDYLRHLPLFHSAGWPTLLFDCRGQGASDGDSRRVSFGAREHRDVSSAVAWLKRERDFRQVVAMGTSQGGASVILAAARDHRIDGVVAENSFARVEDFLWHAAKQLPAPLRWLTARIVRWRTFGRHPEPVDVVATIAPRPILFIHGDRDEIVPPEQSKQLFEKAGEPKQLWIAPGAGHTQVYDVHSEEYANRVLEFLNRFKSGATTVSQPGPSDRP